MIEKILSQQVIRDYSKIFDKMPKNNLSLLLTCLQKMKLHGVDGFGYREVDNKGNSSVFSTSTNGN
jgi:hypothetical protein